MYFSNGNRKSRSGPKARFGGPDAGVPLRAAIVSEEGGDR
jgi:hypothetical protein